MSARKPQVWRKMQTGVYPGLYSVSSAEFLSFSAIFASVTDLNEEEPRPTIRVTYRIDGDEINGIFCHNIEDAFGWLKDKLEKAIADNKAALEAGEDRQVEDT